MVEVKDVLRNSDKILGRRVRAAGQFQSHRYIGVGVTYRCIGENAWEWQVFRRDHSIAEGVSFGRKAAEAAAGAAVEEALGLLV